MFGEAEYPLALVTGVSTMVTGSLSLLLKCVRVESMALTLTSMEVFATRYMSNLIATLVASVGSS